MDNQDGSGETLCDLSQARIAPYTNTWKRLQKTVFWCKLKLAQQRGLQFYQTRSNAVILFDTLPAEFIERAFCMKTKDQLYERESVILRPRVVLKSKFAMWFTRSTCTRSKIILGIATRCGELRRNPKQHCRLQNTWYIDLDSETAGCTATKYGHNADWDVRKTSAQGTVPWRHESKAGDQQVQRGITTITRRHEPNRDLRTLREFCKKISVLIAMLFFFFFEIGIKCCSCGRNLKYSWSRTTLQKTNLLQSLALSLRRIPVEDQNMVSLKDRWCSTGGSICWRKRDKLNTETIRRYFQGGTNKKDTESHWRSTTLAKRKSCFSIGWLLKDTAVQQRKLNGCRTPNIGVFVWMLMGLKSLFDRDQNLPLH